MFVFFRKLYFQEELTKFLSPLLFFLEDNLSKGHSILVHCLAGAHRYLKKTILIRSSDYKFQSWNHWNYLLDAFRWVGQSAGNTDSQGSEKHNSTNR